MNTKWLYGRNVVVTGCSAGMGRDITELLISKYGCNVMGVARNKSKLDEMKSTYKSKFDYRRFDISSFEDWQGFASELDEMGFKVDLLVNNAGMIQPFGQFNDMTMDQVMKVVNTNMLSVVYGCKAMLPAIKASMFGTIVNVSSASAILPVGGESVYSMTKSAVTGLSYSLNQELKGFGGKVLCVMPGPVKTDLYKPREGESAAKADDMVANIGITSKVAAKRIVKAISKRKSRVIIDIVARFMDIGMKMCPVLTQKITSSFMKAVSGKVVSFQPIFAEEKSQSQKINIKLSKRKDDIRSKTSDAGREGFFKNN